MFSLFITLTAPALSASILFYLLNRKNKELRDMRGCIKDMATELATTKREHALERNRRAEDPKEYFCEINRLRLALADVENGWIPASHANCFNKYSAIFKYKNAAFCLQDRVNYFTSHGVVFRDNGLVEYDKLLIRLF